MDIKRCERGHYFDSRKHGECPFCEPAFQPEKSLLSLDDLVEVETSADAQSAERSFKVYFLRCERGHYFNKYMSATCPYCVPPDGEITAEITVTEENQSDRLNLEGEEIYEHAAL